jgi:hypothetical protein
MAKSLHQDLEDENRGYNITIRYARENNIPFLE